MFEFIDRKAALAQLASTLEVDQRYKERELFSTVRCELLRAIVYAHLSEKSIPIRRDMLLRRARRIVRSLAHSTNQEDGSDESFSLGHLDVDDDLDDLLEIGDLDTIGHGIIPTPTRYLADESERTYVVLSGTPTHLLSNSSKTVSFGRMRIATRSEPEYEYSFNDLPNHKTMTLEMASSVALKTAQEMAPATLSEQELNGLEYYAPESAYRRWQRRPSDKIEPALARLKNPLTTQSIYFLTSGKQATQISAESYFCLSYWIDRNLKLTNISVTHQENSQYLTVHRPPPRSLQWRLDLMPKFKDQQNRNVYALPQRTLRVVDDALTQLGVSNL